MSGKVAAISSGTAQTVTPRTAPVAVDSGKSVPSAGKVSPAQLESIRALNLDQVVRDLNIRSRSVGRALRFQVDVVSGSSVIQVLDRDTGELIRQIPPEELRAATLDSNAARVQLVDDLV